MITKRKVLYNSPDLEEFGRPPSPILPLRHLSYWNLGSGIQKIEIYAPAAIFWWHFWSFQEDIHSIGLSTSFCLEIGPTFVKLLANAKTKTKQLTVIHWGRQNHRRAVFVVFRVWCDPEFESLSVPLLMKGCEKHLESVRESWATRVSFMMQ